MPFWKSSVLTGEYVQHSFGRIADIMLKPHQSLHKSIVEYTMHILISYNLLLFEIQRQKNQIFKNQNYVADCHHGRIFRMY